jgi:hypothetical protein
MGGLSVLVRDTAVDGLLCERADAVMLVERPRHRDSMFVRIHSRELEGAAAVWLAWQRRTDGKS